MSGQDYDYGDDFVAVDRYSSHPRYGNEPETDRDIMHAALRRSQRERAESATFTPQSSGPTHSEVDSADELAYFSTKHHQFESSFRSIRGRERAPLAPRLWDMRNVHPRAADVGQQGDT
ncbi:hypothetical protein LPJ70_006821, partial [Coemansia sp. RSA 2708]